VLLASISVPTGIKTLKNHLPNMTNSDAGPTWNLRSINYFRSNSQVPTGAIRNLKMPNTAATGKKMSSSGTCAITIFGIRKRAGSLAHCSSIRASSSARASLLTYPAISRNLGSAQDPLNFLRHSNRRLRCSLKEYRPHGPQQMIARYPLSQIQNIHRSLCSRWKKAPPIASTCQTLNILNFPAPGSEHNYCHQSWVQGQRKTQWLVPITANTG